MTIDIGISTTYWVKGAFSGNCYVPSKMEYWSAGVLGTVRVEKIISIVLLPLNPLLHNSIPPLPQLRNEVELIHVF